ncbi:MAG: calcium-binding protein, partial [Alphaproteobacteria bacterium]
MAEEKTPTGGPNIAGENAGAADALFDLEDSHSKRDKEPRAVEGESPAVSGAHESTNANAHFGNQVNLSTDENESTGGGGGEADPVGPEGPAVGVVLPPLAQSPESGEVGEALEVGAAGRDPGRSARGEGQGRPQSDSEGVRSTTEVGENGSDGTGSAPLAGSGASEEIGAPAAVAAEPPAGTDVFADELDPNLDAPLASPPVTVAGPDLSPVDLTFSNGTISQRFQNRDDSYSLDDGAAGSSVVLGGGELGIAGVPNNAKITTTFDNEGDPTVTLDSAWNSVKNVYAESAEAADVSLNNFVHTDVSFGGSGDSHVTITDAKRGIISTGSGDDAIDITALSNGAGWSNNFDVSSGAGDDTITIRGDRGFTTADVDAGAGDDTVIFSGSGAATLDGGAGDDTLIGGSGADTLLGGGGDDTFLGGDGSDRIVLTGNRADYQITKNGDGTYTIVDQVGDGGTDTIASIETLQFADGDVAIADLMQPSVTLTGTGGSDTIIGSAAAEYILGGGGHDRLEGRGGDDWIEGGSGQDTMLGGDGDDVFKISGSDRYYDSFSGGDGDDTILGGDGDDTIRVHTISASDSIEVIDGGGGSNTLAGTGGSDRIDVSGITLNNIDVIDAGGGHDRVTGTSGDDTIIGGRGQDTLVGGDGDDVFKISGSDRYYDSFSGGDGSDTILGGDGDDTIRVHTLSASDSIEVIDGGGGSNTLAGTGGSDTIDVSGITLNNIDVIDAGGGHDRVTGTSGDDTIIGGKGQDTLVSGDGDDVFKILGSDRYYDSFSGGDGDDTILGGDGDDTIRVHKLSAAERIEVIDGGGGSN